MTKLAVVFAMALGCNTSAPSPDAGPNDGGFVPVDSGAGVADTAPTPDAPAPADPCAPPGGEIQTRDIKVNQPGTGRLLAAKVYAPLLPNGGRVQCPAVAILPGAGATRAPAAAVNLYDWAGRALAAAGYVALFVVPAEGTDATADPTGYASAQRSGLDCLVDEACNPWSALVDSNALGVAGHSQGARASALVQQEDGRVKAMVAWDNLASTLFGDAGTGVRCEVAEPGPPIRPRVPAMGQASETCDKTADAKSSAWQLWRQSGIPSMQLSFAGFSHSSWARDQTPQTTALASFYTIAWFDRYLKADPSADVRLLSRQPAGIPVQTALSARYHSAYFDGMTTCADVRHTCP